MVALPYFLRADTYLRTSYIGSVEKAFQSPVSESAKKDDECSGSECAATIASTKVVDSTPAQDPDTHADLLYGRLGLLAAFLLSGAIGARLGPTIAPWRGALASGLGCLALMAPEVLSRPYMAFFGAVLILIGTALGYAGGCAVRFSATSAVRAGP